MGKKGGGRSDEDMEGSSENKGSEDSAYAARRKFGRQVKVQLLQLHLQARSTLLEGYATRRILVQQYTLIYYLGSSLTSFLSFLVRFPFFFFFSVHLREGGGGRNNPYSFSKGRIKLGMEGKLYFIIFYTGQNFSSTPLNLRLPLFL